LIKKYKKQLENNIKKLNEDIAKQKALEAAAIAKEKQAIKDRDDAR
jgi:hypothetical protein